MKLGWDFTTNHIDPDKFSSLEDVVNFIIDDSCWKFRGVIKFEIDADGDLCVNYTLPQKECFPFLQPGLNKINYEKLSYDAKGAADWDTGRFVFKIAAK